MARVLILFLAAVILSHSSKAEATSESLHSSILGKEKVTHLHFYFHDIVGGDRPTAMPVAGPAKPGDSPVSFGTVFAIDDPLTEGPELGSKVIGNAQGIYVSSGYDQLSLAFYVDFGFTDGEFKGSSFSVFSRNPVLNNERELAVVGGREKFRLTRGFARLRTHFINATSGEAIVEYNVTLLHYESTREGEDGYCMV